MPLRRPFLVAVAVLAAAVACSDSSAPATSPVASVVVTGLPDSVGLGDVLTLAASPRARDGSPLPDAVVTWRSLTPTYASVTPEGRLTAAAAGDARIVASTRLRGTREDTIAFTVRRLPRRLTWRELPESLVVGDTLRLRPVVQDGLGDQLLTPVTFSSGDTSLAGIVDSGLVRAHFTGTVWIRAQAGRVVDSIPLRLVGFNRAPIERWPGTRWATVAPGGFPTQTLDCALDVAGQLSCASGLLPLTARGGPALRSIASGYTQACGLAADGGAWCLGSNVYGELGLGYTGGTAPNLVASTPGRTWRQLDVGDNRTLCGIEAADSVVYCWGRNDFGQTGREIGLTTVANVAPFITPLKAKKVDVGYFSGCAIALDDALWCWGEPLAFLGQELTKQVPTRLSAPGAYVDVAVGGLGLATCALAPDGVASCWGDDVAPLQGGATRYTPMRVRSSVPFARLVGATNGARVAGCGLTTSGALYCFVRVSDRNDLAAVPVLSGSRFRTVGWGYRGGCGIPVGEERILCFQ